MSIQNQVTDVRLDNGEDRAGTEGRNQMAEKIENHKAENNHQVKKYVFVWLHILLCVVIPWCAYLCPSEGVVWFVLIIVIHVAER